LYRNINMHRRPPLRQQGSDEAKVGRIYQQRMHGALK
jgi:hypothetical protein